MSDYYHSTPNQPQDFPYNPPNQFSSIPNQPPNRPHYTHHPYNNTPYTTPSMHSVFSQRQYNINPIHSEYPPPIQNRGRGRGRGGGHGRIRHAPVPSTRGRGRGNIRRGRGRGRGRVRGRGRGHAYSGGGRGINSKSYIGKLSRTNQKRSKKKYKKITSSSSMSSMSSGGGSSHSSSSYDSDTRPHGHSDTRRTTKSKYYKKETIRHAIKDNEMRIEGNGSVEEYVEYALELLNNKNKNKMDKIVFITATGRAISKAINMVEVIKRKQYGLHQETSIEYKKIQEIWKPLELCLKQVVVEYEITYVKISLTWNKNLVNNLSIGYQPPISWIDLGDAREYYNKMQGKINKLKGKLATRRDEIDDLEDRYQDKCDDFTDLRDERKTDYNDLENKYDEKVEDIRLKQLIIDEQKKDYRDAMDDMDNLQEKYDKLIVQSVERKETKKKYDILAANELVDLIVNIDKEKYEKYRDGLLRGFIEEGIDGSCLHAFTQEDLYRFGVTQFKDKLGIFNAIKNLL